MKMKAPENCAGFSVGGNKYAVDKKGFADIDNEDVENAKRHGFTPVEAAKVDKVEEPEEDEADKPLRK